MKSDPDVVAEATSSIQSSIQLLPCSVKGGRDFARLAAEAAFPNRESMSKTQPQPPNPAFLDFLRSNTTNDFRTEFLKWCSSFFLPAAFNRKDIVLIARSAIQTEEDFKTFSPFLDWYFGSSGNISDANTTYVFSQMLECLAASPLKHSSAKEFVNSRIRKDSRLYWASNGLHEMYVRTLMDFNSCCNPGDLTGEEFFQKRDLVPLVSRVLRRVVDAKDRRYKNLVGEGLKMINALTSDVIKRFSGAPELYELRGLFLYAVERMEAFEYQQKVLPLMDLNALLCRRIKKTLSTHQFNVQLLFSRQLLPVVDGLCDYSYKVKLVLSVNLESEADMEEWLRLRAYWVVSFTTDNPINSHVGKNTSRKRFSDDRSSNQIEAEYTFKTTSLHCRVGVDVYFIGGENVFSGLTFDLPTGIPELDSNSSFVTQVAG